MKEIYSPKTPLPSNFEIKIQDVLHIRDMGIIRSKSNEPPNFEVMRFMLPYKDKFYNDLILVISCQNRSEPNHLQVLLVSNTSEPSVLYTTEAKAITIFDNAVQILGNDQREEYSAYRGAVLTHEAVIILSSSS